MSYATWFMGTLFLILILLQLFGVQPQAAPPYEPTRLTITQVGFYDVSVWNVGGQCFATWKISVGLTSQRVPCPWEVK